MPLGSEIQRDIASADRISLILSFLKLSGLTLIYEDLQKFCSEPHHRLRIITTTYCGITEAKAVERLSQLPNTEIRISYNTDIERLHAKSYIFERASGLSTAYIGSSNLSKSAQTEGLEWNIRVTNVENPPIIKTALATFELYWNSHNFEDFRLGGIEKFHRELQIRQTPKISTEILSRYVVLPHQKQILDRLSAVRESGTLRNLIIAATGTGKTVISAFDYKRFCDARLAGAKILFVAHREEILRQALHTYRSVLADQDFGDLWVGAARPVGGIDYLFVSVQTFQSKNDEIFANCREAILRLRCHRRGAPHYGRQLPQNHCSLCAPTPYRPHCHPRTYGRREPSARFRRPHQRRDSPAQRIGRGTAHTLSVSVHQRQNTASHTNDRGRGYTEQATNKRKFLLFVREDKKDGFGNTSPFYCFGLVDYISSRDDKPMSIDWRMHQPILPQFVKAV